jgi:hypothetical protein
LFNETQRMETARKLAERLIKHDKRDNARMEYLFSLLTSRKPKTAEATALSELLGQAKSRFSKSPEDAKEILSQGLSSKDESLQPAEVAAWTQVAATVLASDPAILLY